MRRAALAVAAVPLAILAWSSPASAWYFPEHVVIAKDAVDQQPAEIRQILRGAVLRARAEALPLCPNVAAGLEDLSVDTPLRTAMVRAPLGLDCVPFTALPALAGDHSDGPSELRAVVVGPRGRELTVAASYEWRHFLEEIERAPKAPLERMAFVHELDVDFYYIDPGYHLRAGRTHAHFVDAGRPLAQVVRNAGLGGVDNAVAQFIVHHVRSLESASRGRVAEALLEHGFAVHFLQDAFSAGHLVISDAQWVNGNNWARLRHDFFDARGVRVTHAASVEPCHALDEALEAGLPPCWTTLGDGYLGAAPDSSERMHVVRAVRKAQIQLALAVDAARVQKFFDALGEREKIAFAEYLDPAPWWTLPRTAKRARPANANNAEKVMLGAVQAITRLREGPTTMPVVDVGSRPRSALLSHETVSTATDPCAPAETEDSDAPCGAGRALALGTVGASLLRPLLVELPAATDDVATLQGQNPLDHGIAFHLLAGVSTGALFPPRAPVDLYAPAIGVTMGIAYRFGTYLPGRRNRSAVELNAGVSTALHYDSHGRAGGHPQVTMLTQEIRWPILWEVVASYMPPLDLRKVHDSGSLILFGGARLHEAITDHGPRLWGADLEIAALALSRGRGAHPLYSVSPEIRLHAGFADPSVVQPSLAGVWGPTISLSFVGGYATFF